jgi:hypothetical protein
VANHRLRGRGIPDGSARRRRRSFDSAEVRFAPNDRFVEGGGLERDFVAWDDFLSSRAFFRGLKPPGSSVASGAEARDFSLGRLRLDLSPALIQSKRSAMFASSSAALGILETNAGPSTPLKCASLRMTDFLGGGELGRDFVAWVDFLSFRSFFRGLKPPAPSVAIRSEKPGL